MTDSQSREEIHAKVLHNLMDDKIFEDEATLLSFRDSAKVLKGAYIKSTDDQSVSLCCNLPLLNNKLFLTVSDGCPNAVTGLMSQLEEITANNAEIDMYHAVRFNDEYFLEKGVVGVLLLPISVSPALKHVSPEIHYKGDKIELFLVVFLSEEEYLFWKAKGNNQLMDKFEKDDKDLVSMKKRRNQQAIEPKQVFQNDDY